MAKLTITVCDLCGVETNAASPYEAMHRLPDGPWLQNYGVHTKSCKDACPACWALLREHDEAVQAFLPTIAAHRRELTALDGRQRVEAQALEKKHTEEYAAVELVGAPTLVMPPRKRP